MMQKEMSNVATEVLIREIAELNPDAEQEILSLALKYIAKNKELDELSAFKSIPKEVIEQTRDEINKDPRRKIAAEYFAHNTMPILR
jgi:hypothetical protein